MHRPGSARRGMHALCALLVLTATTTLPSLAEAKRLTRNHAHLIRRTSQPRDAALIIDAASGQVLFAENASEPRYPASLTKMMTLYLTFDALKSGKLKLDQQMYVSARAANMPQTNLAMRAGTYLQVETAIRALVVRSANDAAVVLAETLGGNEAGFAEMMTKKARQIGMGSTTFKNANGLPNPGQRTTARDMAVLGMALSRDFPKYYPYFKTTQFSYAGKTYTTHNRVMLHYPGCDGLKTGFIGASGFNLVSSVHRNGRYLVGVVLGGPSGNARDLRMMALMDRALGLPVANYAYAKNPAIIQPSTQLAVANMSPQAGRVVAQQYSARGRMGDEQRVASRGRASSPAMARRATGPESAADTSEPEIAQGDEAGPVSTPEIEVADAPETEPAVASTLAEAPPLPEVPAAKPSAMAAAKAAIKPMPAQVIRASMAESHLAPLPLNQQPRGVQMAMLQPSAATPKSDGPNAAAAVVTSGWGIQVGAFERPADAKAAAVATAKKLPQELAHAQPLDPESTGKARARLGGLTEAEARSACRKIVAGNGACFVFKN